MHEPKLEIADIQTTDLLFYDPAFGDQGYAFCLKRNIDCLPCLDDADSFYLRNDQTRKFDKEKLADERLISGEINIFHPALLSRFRVYPLLFVQDHDELSGVVHFSDYNKPVVSDFLYRRLAAYERDLRRLAKKSKLKDADMGGYFREKLEQREEAGEDGRYFEGRLDAFERLQDRSTQVPPFQPYYMNDLVGLLKHRDIIELQGKVLDLRNSVMHAHEFVNMVDVKTPDYIYVFATFKVFFERVQSLLHDARRVANRLHFLSGNEWAEGAGIIATAGQE